MGRIANNLELKTTPSGASMLTFRLAVDRRFQVKGEDKKADFFNVVAWQSTAEFISKYFAKGRMILVEGELQTRQYTDKAGNAVNTTEIIADRACFTGEKTNGSQAAAPAVQAVPNAAAPAAGENDSDYPF